MRFAVLVLVVTLAACGSSTTPPADRTHDRTFAAPPDAVSPDAGSVSGAPDAASAYNGPATDGSKGAVCQWGDRNGNETWAQTQPDECDPGLSCCYPCGIDGCNFVCATPQECQSWMTLP